MGADITSIVSRVVAAVIDRRYKRTKFFRWGRLAQPGVDAYGSGALEEKILPYLRSLYDALYDMLETDEIQKFMDRGIIEIAPLAYMRGRTLNHSFVVLDEAQNTTAEQMFMFLTRLGENARMVVTGDLSQVDLPRGTRSGLRDASEILGSVKGVAFTRFSHEDVVRHKLVTRIVRAYDDEEMRRRASARYEKGGDPKGDG